MKPNNFASQLPIQPANVDELSDLKKELRLLKERITTLEAECHSVFGSLQNRNLQMERSVEIADVHDAHITIQRQHAGAIAIAINAPQSTPTTPTTSRTIQQAIFSPQTEIQCPSHVMSSSLQPAMFGNPALPQTPSQRAPSPAPISFVPSDSQLIGSSSSWGLMMTPREVQELLASQPQTGEYYVVTKGRRPGVYLSWPDTHELIDGLKNACYWKRTDRHVAQGQYTVAYNKGNCEYRFK